MEKRLVECLEANYGEIVAHYSERVSSGNTKLDIRDVAKLNLYSLRGISTDIEFQQFISDALGDSSFRFSSENAPAVQRLIQTLKSNGYSDKHPMVRLLREKLPLQVAKPAVRSQLHAVQEAISQNAELKRLLEEQSLKYAMEHNPQHLFVMLASLPKDNEHMQGLRALCMEK